MAVLIRKPDARDAEAIHELIRQLGYERSLDDVRESLEQLDVFIAEIDGAVAGLIQMCIVSSIQSATFAEIRALVVDEKRRGQGIGAALVAAGEQWARDRALKRVRVRSNTNRDGARRFYERLGFKVTKTSNTFDRSLR